MLLVGRNASFRLNTMAESDFEDEMEERYFEDLLRESDVRGCLYEPQYNETQLRLTEEQGAAAAEEQSLPGVMRKSPYRVELGRTAGASALAVRLWTQIESRCCCEFQRCHFLLEEITESALETGPPACVIEHPSFDPHEFLKLISRFRRSMGNACQSPQGQTDDSV
ncbi:hypothetical protein DPEC_G00003420 [Dallia pectoralis]|uniref:Uncharacterized protein n=1 Tax=Dallia pectoralis TaxID=75939 RepID=A0ACC2HJ79_DALPE|nr:hypothetical protein DPEC_G00003420 [Dallia pectoralis]